MTDNTIFDLQQSKKDTELIVQNSDIELDVATNIMEQVSDFPYIGSLIKLGKVALNYIDYRFFLKLGKFLKQANEIPEDKVSNFLNNLSPKDKKRISDYLTQLLYNAEEDEKAEFMGKIYNRRVLGEINNEMMLRLCSIINRAYISDLRLLKDYDETTSRNDYVTDNLFALGILADEGNVYEEKGDGWESTGFGPSKHILNEIGLTLLRILTDEPIGEVNVKRRNGPNVSFRNITNKEIEDMFK